MAEPAEEIKSKILDRMRRLCSMREYCSYDIRNKILNALNRREQGAQAADEILSWLIKDGYVNDSRYASAFARDKASLSGWGRAKIRQALILKRIDKDVIASALEEIDDEKATEKLRKALETKAKSLKGKPDARQRLLRFAAGRGYSYDEAISILENLSL